MAFLLYYIKAIVFFGGIYMRRFIAYISLILAVVFSTALSIKPTLNSVNSKLDFSGGQELTYQLTNLDESIADTDVKFDTDGAAKEVAKVMSSRLDTYGVEQYDIKIDGNDTIRVSLNAKNSDTYNHIQNYLNFDGRLTMETSDGEYMYSNFNSDNDKVKNMFTRNAYITFKGVYPAVVLPIKNVDEFKKAVEHAKSLDKKDETQSSEQSTASDASYIYLWTDWDDNCTYENAKTYQSVASRLVMKFAYSNIWWEEKEENYSSIVAYFNVTTDTSNTNTNINDLKIKDIESANENAKYFTSLLNTESYNYTVNFVHSKSISAVVGNAINQGTYITPVVNFALIGFCIFFALLVGFAFVFYRLIGVNFVVNSLLGLIATGAIFNALGATYSIASLVGFALIGILMIGVGVVYLHRIKTELAKGKLISKSVSDVNNSMVLLTLDTSAIMLILGIFIYIFGGPYISAIGVALFIAAFVNLFVNLLLNRLTFTFLATSKFGANYALYGIINEAKANVNEEEAEHNVLDDIKAEQAASQPVPSKKKGLSRMGFFGIFYGLVIIAGIVCVTTFGLTSTPFIESSLIESDTRLVVSAEKSSTILKDAENLTNIIDKVEVGTDSAKSKIYASADSISTFDFSDETTPTDLKDIITRDYVYYIVRIDSSIHYETANIYVNGVVQSGHDLGSILEEQINAVDDLATVSFKSSASYDLTDNYYLPSIALASSIALIGVAVYLCVRYRSTLAISTGLISMGTAAIALTIFSMLRTAVSPYIGLAAIVATIFSAFVGLLILEENKFEHKTVKGKVKSIEDKSSEVKESLSVSRDLGLGIAVVGLIFMLSFLFGGTEATKNLFIFTSLIIVLSFVSLVNFAVPLYSALMKLVHNITSKVHLPESNKKKLKNKHREHQRGKEVEEATFIGIND